MVVGQCCCNMIIQLWLTFARLYFVVWVIRLLFKLVFPPRIVTWGGLRGGGGCETRRKGFTLRFLTFFEGGTAIKTVLPLAPGRT